MIQKDYSDSFSDEKFWNKITRMPETAGCSVLRAAFTLYVLLKTKSVPLWTKGLCVFAIGWLIAPFDGCFHDPTPGIGYLDDLAIMTLVIEQLYPNHERGNIQMCILKD